jgi:hypothetical protein
MIEEQAYDGQHDEHDGQNGAGALARYPLVIIISRARHRRFGKYLFSR